MTQLRRRSFVFCSAGITAGACNRHRDSGQNVRLLLASTPASFAVLPHTIAQQLRIYEREGLKILSEIVPGGGTKGIQALLGGSADVVAGYYDQSVRMAAEGRALQSFVTMTRYPGNVIITSPDRSTHKRIEELKNSLIGVSELGAQSHLFLNYVLGRHGLTAADFTAISMGTQQAAIAALERGQRTHGRVLIRA